jgi:hypothetical protein
VSWVEIFAAFIVSHLVGDYLLQTDWQARNKRLGLAGDPVRRRALVSHVTVYTLTFVPTLIVLSDDLGAGVIWVAALIFIPHLIQDDARVLIAWNRSVKRSSPVPGDYLYIAIDQSFHVVFLFGTALLAVT